MTSNPPPSGTLCFLFTDLEGSTKLWEEHEEAMQDALALHDEIVRQEIAKRSGYVFSIAGDAFGAAFERVDDGLEAATAIQEALALATWPIPEPVRIRIGLHVGDAQERDGNYFGPTLNRAARIMSAAHGGQTLLSDTAAALSRHGRELMDLGEHRLKDLQQPERLWQAGSGEFAPLRTLDRYHHNLSTERTALLGRDDDIAAITKLLEEHRLVSLLGIGGTGKTRLAVAVGAETVDRFPDGVWFVDLVPARSEDDMVTAISDATGLSPAGDDLLTGMASALRDRQLLLILDNCEHLTDVVADVVDVLLEETDTPKLLITSREPLGFTEEQQFPVAPLDATDELSPAVELLAAAAERAGAVLNPEGARRLREIAEQLDGHPLSLELAAAQLRQLTPEELIERLDQRFALLETRRRGSRQSHRQRQASLLAVLEDTCSLLDGTERELLLLLAAFPASFRTDDVEGIAAGSNLLVPLRSLSGLVDRGLVDRTTDGRLRLLETVKLYAREQWADDNDPGRFLDAHTHYVLGHLRSYAPEDRYVDYGMAGWILRRADDVRAIEDRLVTAGRWDEVGELYSLLTLTIHSAGGTQASAYIDRADLLLSMEGLTSEARGLVGLAAGFAGVPARRPNWFARGSNLALETLNEARRPEAVAAALVVHSWPLAFTDLPRSLTALRRAQTVADSVGARRLGTMAVGYAANHLLLAGRAHEAEPWHVEVGERLANEAPGYQTGVNSTNVFKMTVLADPSKALVAQGAINHMLEAAIGTVTWEWHLPSLIATTSLGDIEKTQRAFLEIDDLTRLTRTDGGLPDNLLPLATLAWRLGDLERARRWLTAIRRSPTPTQNFNLTAVYRQLRDETGLSEENPLDEMTIEDVYAEARRWLDGLDDDH